jgi:hypothetical protein
MDWQIIILSIGVFISLVLGVINLLAHREKVAIVNPEVYTEFLPKGTREKTYRGSIVALSNDVLAIEVKCELVLKSGENELEVKEVEAILASKACKNLRKYFHFPLLNRLQLSHINAYEGKPIPQPILLEPKKAVQFKRKIPLNYTDEFEKEHKKTKDNPYPESIQPFLDELETKYQICWTRYDGKRLCWRFPQKWWRNLGKKLWG